MERALTKVCDYINNYFEREIHGDTYTVENNTLICPFLADGQYFRIKGSVFNDGIHQYPALDLKDETFTGEVWALAIPEHFIDIAMEIYNTDAFISEYEATDGKYISESFGGYTYTLAVNTYDAAIKRRDELYKHLNRYRKVW